MACLSPSRLCARVQDKLLCQLGYKVQVRRQTIFVKLKPPGPSPLRIFGKTCQRVATCGPACGTSGVGAVAAAAGVARRQASSLQSTSTGSLPDYGTQIVDPYRLLEDDLNGIYEEIRLELERNTNQSELKTIATYYFDGQGKALRPMVAILMAKAVNYHVYGENSALLQTQRQVAMISEMIHSASLIHDDVIDQSDFRRGKPSVNVLWNHKKVAMAGDFILAVASMMIARLRSDDVTLVLSQVVTDLVQGEFMQLGSKETENERFAHYLTKTYRKTASLIANSVKAVALLSGADEATSELAFQYGRNLGLAFQLVDDLLDFVSSAQAMGKPTAADLKLGLATAPVLFACEKYPELNPMIMRRFQETGDVEKAFELVHKSRGLEQTRFLARQHGAEAARLAHDLAPSPYQKGLTVTADLVLNRIKRLSAQTSGSARRRARERQQAQNTRAEGERIARETRETRARNKLNEQRENRQSLASYEPWGRAGGGAPNPHSIRYTDLRAREIYPDDELRGISKFDLDCRRWVSPRRHRRRSKLRFSEDPQFGYTGSVRQSVGNDVSYRNISEQQKTYKQILDEMVDKRKIAERERRKKDLEYEKLMRAMDGPWGRPGPGGAIWRNPRSIGMNFSQSMGWTDNKTFNKMKGENKHLKKSSLTLPKVKRGDDFSGHEMTKSCIEKLPDINQTNTAISKENKELTRINNDINNVSKTRAGDKKPRKAKFVKKLANGDKIYREDPEETQPIIQESIEPQVDVEHNTSSDTKLTPEETILRSTGGIELVPLLARRRRFGARTLPSSDVTRPPEQDCQWRNAANMNYLSELKRQVHVKTLQKEANRQESAEDVKQHHATWSSWWGRPGHGAPQRGRYARNNLALLLHAPPLPKIRV